MSFYKCYSKHLVTFNKQDFPFENPVRQIIRLNDLVVVLTYAIIDSGKSDYRNVFLLDKVKGFRQIAAQELEYVSEEVAKNKNSYLSLSISPFGDILAYNGDYNFKVNLQTGAANLYWNTRGFGPGRPY